jgi:hypothetical protein
MRTLLIAIFCGYLGYQIGKNGFGDISKFVIQKKTKVSETVEDISYLKITESGQISFVGDKESATILSSISAKNAINFLMGVFECSSLNLISA